MGLSENEAKKQIKQMIEFIRLEASEKVEEIQQKTASEYNNLFLDKRRKFEAEVDDEFKARKNQDMIRKKIEMSKEKSKSKFSVMEFRNSMMNGLKADVLKQLNGVAKNAGYPELLKFLLVQGLLGLQEEHVSVICRKEDLKLVQAQLDAAKALYLSTIKDKTGVTSTINLTIDDKKSLPAGPDGTERESCCGGVLLSARNGKILSRNTLDARLEIAFYALKPQLRGMLFGVRPQPVVKANAGHVAHH